MSEDVRRIAIVRGRCGVILSRLQPRLGRLSSTAFGVPSSLPLFDAHKRDVMGSKVGGLLDRITQILEAAKIPSMVAGSFASTTHGLPRSPQDLDLIIDPPSAAAFEAMPADKYYVDSDTARDALRIADEWKTVQAY
jgi:hypothetical protein